MATFNWKIQSGWQVTQSPNVAVVKLGDGYEQRQVKGINSLLDSYTITVVGIENLCGNRPNIAREAAAFLKARNAVEAFDWKSPDAAAARKFICRSWVIGRTGTVWTLTATFEQVVR